MSRLVWIDVRQFAPKALVAFGVGFMIARGTPEIGPGAFADALFKLSLVIGAIFGVGLLWPGFPHRGEYRLHRRTSLREQMAASWIAFALVASVWVIGFPLLVIDTTTFGGSLTLWIAVLSAVLGGFAFGAWATAVPATTGSRIALLLFVSLTIPDQTSLIDSPLPGWIFVASVTLFALAAVEVAHLTERPYDPDRAGGGVRVRLTLTAVWCTVLVTRPIPVFETATFTDLFSSFSPALIAPTELRRWVVGLVLAAHAVAVLRRAGAPRARQQLWGVLVLLTGGGAAIARFMLDPVRAWRPAPTLTNPAPLLRSGASAGWEA